MERRKVLLGMGSFAAGTAGLVGSGAFDQASVNRDAVVSIAGDQRAYLELTATSVYAKNKNNGEIEFNFRGGYSGQRGEGINTRGETCFGDVFQVKNMGTNGVYVWIARKDYEAGGAESVQFASGDEGNVGTSDSNNEEVNIGQPPSRPASAFSNQQVSQNGCTILGGGWIYLNPGEAAAVDIDFFVADADPQNFPTKQWQINASVDEPSDQDYKDSSLSGHPFP